MPRAQDIGRDDGIECFDDLGLSEVLGEHLTGRGLLLVQRIDVTITFRIIVVRIYDYFAFERSGRHLAIIFQWNRHKDNVAERCGLFRLACQSSTLELGEQAQPGKQFYGIAGSIGGRAIVFAGGIPLMSNGQLVGGVGVSGGSGEQDQAVAEAAAAEWR